MRLASEIGRQHRDELVEAAVALLAEGYPAIAEGRLERRLHQIATGHMMNVAGRAGLAAAMPKKAARELDRLFFMMGLRALDEFTLESQLVAVNRLVHGGGAPGLALETSPELGPLLRRRAAATRKAEAVQAKVVMAFAAGRPAGRLLLQRKSAEAAIRQCTRRMEKIAGAVGTAT